jgi:NADH:ubiquinone oxidoreductase subunit H
MKSYFNDNVLNPKVFFYAFVKAYINFFWIYAPLAGAALFFGGWKWNQKNLTLQDLFTQFFSFSILIFIPVFISCYIVHYVKCRRTEEMNKFNILSDKERGKEIGSTLL